jgi:hypothetical protein
MRIFLTGFLANIHDTLRLTGQNFFLKLKNIPRPWQISIAVFLVGRVLFSLWGAVIWFMRLMPTYKGPYYYNVEPVLEGFPGALLGMWQRWDGIVYQQIAMFGYEGKAQSAYFPLYSMLGRWVSYLIGNNALLGLLIVSSAASLVAMWLLYQIVCEEYSSDLAIETLFCLIIFPTTFFFYSTYPQSLLLMFVLLAYWLARHDHWGLAGLAGLGAGLTHITSVVLTLLLGWEAGRSMLRNKEGHRLAKVIASIMNLVAIGGFMAWRNLAGFPSYPNMTKEVWAHGIVLPWDGLAAVGKFIFTLPLDPPHFMSWIYIFVFALIVGLSLWSFRKIPNAMWVYQAALIGLILCTAVDRDPLLGILRYPLVMFPLFIELAMVANTKTWRLVKFTVFALLSLVCSAWFFMWKFVG